MESKFLNYKNGFFDEVTLNILFGGGLIWGRGVLRGGGLFKGGGLQGRG